MDPTRARLLLAELCQLLFLISAWSQWPVYSYCCLPRSNAAANKTQRHRERQRESFVLASPVRTTQRMLAASQQTNWRNKRKRLEAIPCCERASQRASQPAFPRRKLFRRCCGTKNRFSNGWTKEGKAHDDAAATKACLQQANKPTTTTTALFSNSLRTMFR